MVSICGRKIMIIFIIANLNRNDFAEKLAKACLYSIRAIGTG
jgi:hypothetical protein